MSEPFEPCHITTFMGGEFKLPAKPIRTIGELRSVFASWALELNGWGSEDFWIGEVAIVEGGIVVTLATGIPVESTGDET